MAKLKMKISLEGNPIVKVKGDYISDFDGVLNDLRAKFGEKKRR